MDATEERKGILDGIERFLDKGLDFTVRHLGDMVVIFRDRERDDGVPGWNAMVAHCLRETGMSIGTLRILRENMLASQRIATRVFSKETPPGGMSRQMFEKFVADTAERRELVNALDAYIEHFENADESQDQKHLG